MSVQLNNIVSISSLESPEHAKNKDPKVLTVSWMIGKRCNYDCSYCPSWSHDSFSPHLPIEDIKKTIDSISHWTILNDKKFKIDFTGGEPFIHPDFLDVLKYIDSKNNTYSIGVVTNGSAELGTYLEASRYLSNMTISLHIEESEEIIEKTIEKIVYINNNTSMFINVNVMAAAGKVKNIPDIVKFFNEKQINFTINKINLPEIDPDREKKISRKQYKEKKKYFDIKTNVYKNLHRLKSSNKKIKEYYTKEELKIIEKYQSLKEWQDTRVHYKSHTEEKNSLVLLSNGLANFMGWHCYIGIDCIYINYDGFIYRGFCYAGGPIGRISDFDIRWPDKTITCPHSICSCNSDIRTRKAKNTQYLNKITGN